MDRNDIKLALSKQKVIYRKDILRAMSKQFTSVVLKQHVGNCETIEEKVPPLIVKRSVIKQEVVNNEQPKDFAPQFIVESSPVKQEPVVTKVEPLKPAIDYQAEIAKIRNQGFIPHPAQFGYDDVMIRNAVQQRRNQARLNRKKHMQDLPPLSSFLKNKKSLLSNFVNVVPPNFEIKYATPVVPDTTQVTEVSSTSSKEPHPGDEVEVNKELTPKDLMKFAYVEFFNEVCPAFVKQVNGCSKTDCDHSIPAASDLKKMLDATTFDNALCVYELTKKFKSSLRNDYHRVLAEFFANNNMNDALKTMIRDVSDLVPFSGFRFIFEALLHCGWSISDRIQFIIDNHNETEQNQQMIRADILELIGSSLGDVIKFVDYLNMVKGK